MRWLVALCALACLGLGARNSGAIERHSAPGPTTIHPSYKLIRNALAESDGPYTVLLGVQDGQLGTVITERSNAHKVVPPPPGCATTIGPPFVGGPWLLVDCDGSSIDLYALPAGPWRSVPIAESCQAWANTPVMSTCDPIAVGRYWIEFDETCYHCQNTYVFQNIDSATVASDPSSSTILPDLNARSLAHHLCQPLRVPKGGVLQIDGGFAVAGTARAAFLERCGTRLKQQLTGVRGALSLAPDTVVWLARHFTRLSGLLLPSRRAFSVVLPQNLTDLSGVVIADHHLYVNGTAAGLEAVWQTPWPSTGR
jgi:hypothetical protein